MSELKLNVQEARRLHQEGNARGLHGSLNSGLLKAAVYGANDGIITTFAVVAGVAGAGLSPSVVLILGISNIIADGLSMGIGDYLGERSERRHLKYQYQIEKWEIEKIPEEEKQELSRFFQKRNVTDEDTSELTNIIIKYPNLWSELGFIEEMGVLPTFKDPMWKTGIVTFIAFVIAGTLPLLPYLLEFLKVTPPQQHQFLYSIISTGCSLFFVGSLRTFITKGTWWMNGIEMLSIGTIAASAAYILGAFVEQIIR